MSGASTYSRLFEGLFEGPSKGPSARPPTSITFLIYSDLP
jgi:hypothetical protein